MFRREFLNVVVDCLGGLAAALIAIPGLRFLFHVPVGGSRATGFVRVAGLSQLRPGEPLRVLVRADRWDGFVHHPPGPIGSVWLVPGTSVDEVQYRAGDAAPAGAPVASNETVRCLQTVCPHLGCGIDYDSARRRFVCPCHASDFARSGRVLSGPSPRAMDELTCRISEPDADGERWIEVEYREFKTGVSAKEPLA